MKTDLQASPSRLSGIILVLIASACWGSSGIFIFKIVSQSSLSAVGLAFWRDLLSSALLLITILIINPRLLRIEKKDLPWLIAMGVISIGAFHILWNRSVIDLGASLATVIQGNAAVFVTILAWIIFGEELSGRKILAIFAAVGGTILAAGVLHNRALIINPANIGIGLMAALTYGSLSLFGRKLSAAYHPLTIIFYIFTIGTITIFVFQGGNPDPWPVGSNILGWLLGFVMMSTILGFGLYTKALQILPASVAAITATSEILFAVILSSIFLGERLDGWQILGALLIVLSVVFVSIKRRL